MSRPIPSAEHLHLGCGLVAPPEWVNVDGSWQVVFARYPLVRRLLAALHVISNEQAGIAWSANVKWLNLARPLPFADESFVAVYSSHTLEHLYHDDALSLLRESHRVLRKGGVCRAVVPDLESIVSRYCVAKSRGDADAAAQLMDKLLVHDRRPKRGPMGVYHRLTAFHQHKWMYDAASLQLLFHRAGFKQIDCARFRESRISRIGEVEFAERILDGQGIAVEGVKE